MDLLQVKQSRILPGNNPRKFFDPAEMQELTDSVRENGVLQPIIIRRNGESYTLVAGERRLRALRAAFPDEDREVPAVILGEDADDEAVSIIENTQRADMSPAEEAVAVAGLVKKLKGDKDEVARVMGWSRSKVMKRVALTMCSRDVLDSLTERKISLGHAELLAGVPKEKQNDVLPKIIDHGISVSDLKARLQAYCLSLASAPFDKSDCATCKHNSSNQRSLFSEVLDEGQCENPPCFEGKVKSYLDLIKAEMEETYARVEIVGPGDDIYVDLSEKTVGEDQFNTGCKACQNFGCAIHSEPGLVGNRESPVCFDLDCNIKMQANFRKNQQEALSSSSESEPAQSKVKAPSSTPSSCGTCAPSQQASSSKLVEYRRKVVESCILKDAKAKGNFGSIQFSLSASGVRPDSALLDKVLEKLGFGKTFEGFLGAYAKDKDLAVMALASSLVRASTNQQLKSLVDHFQVNLRDYWEYDEAFLDCLTKSQIEALLDEIGYSDGKSADDLKKIVTGKKSEIIKRLLDDPDFKGCHVTPACMSL